MAIPGENLANSFQSTRRELKYLVPESMAQSIRGMVGAYLDPDVYTKIAPPDGYQVKSLYLDSASQSLYFQTKRGLKNRFKLRIRFYDDDVQAPAFLEVKRRDSESILKTRAEVTKQDAESLLDGAALTRANLSKPDISSCRGLSEFDNLCRSIGARGSVFVTYHREGYQSPGSNRVRVTFDRQLQAARFNPKAGICIDSRTIPVPLDGVILEFKFTDRFPSWMAQISRTFNLQKRSVAKYIYCRDSIDRVSVFPSGSGVLPSGSGILSKGLGGRAS